MLGARHHSKGLSVCGLVREVEQLESELSPHISCAGPMDLPIISRQNYYRAFHMKLRSSVWELLKDARNSPQAQQCLDTYDTQLKICKDSIARLSDEVLETIPLVLDIERRNFSTPLEQNAVSFSRPRKWHDALSLMWPLRLIAWFELSSKDQKTAARAGLRRIASEFYIMHAVNAS